MKIAPVIPSLLISMAFFAILSGCTAEVEEQEFRDPVVVEGVEAQISTRSLFVTYPGTLEPWKQVNVGSNAPGRIDRIYVQEGDRIQAGDPLVQMVDNQLRQARIAYQTTKREYERLLPLREEGAVTRQQIDMAQTEYENAQVNLGLLEENTILRSRMDGVVTEKWFEEGELYSASPTASGSPGIIQVMQLDTLKLMVRANESMLPYITEGQRVYLSADALPGREFESRVWRIFPTVNPDNRSFRVEILIDNREGLLKPGMFARAELETRSQEGLFIPREALMRGTSSNSRDVVFLVDESNRATRQVVTTGVFLDDVVAIEDGLEPGSFVVIKGRQRLESGMEVEKRKYEP
ncbi:efflux RND transporter periplasmic adaptor subunit [Balneolales bacterium ANBcel1]|nr:efflux RND transporter periplasmic adaptor subunit [Balneolales bacterium ANBcel1]